MDAYVDIRRRECGGFISRRKIDVLVTWEAEVEAEQASTYRS